MPVVRTIARPPLSDSVMVHIPKEYQSYSLEIIIVPVDAGEKVPFFGALKGKIKYIAPDFDEPLEDFAEYM